MTPLLGFVWGWQEYTLIALSALLAGAVVGFGFRKDDKIEQRRYAAIEIGDFLSSLGLMHAKKFFDAYAVTDLSGMWNEAKAIVGILRDPKLRKSTVFSVVEHAIPMVMDDEAETRKCLLLAHRAALSKGFDLHKMLEEELAKTAPKPAA